MKNSYRFQGTSYRLLVSGLNLRRHSQLFRPASLFLFPFLFLILLSACSDRHAVPPGIVKPEEMREVMWDLINAGEFASAYAYRDTTVDHFTTSAKIYGEVLQVHKLTREQFDKSYLYYREHPKLMMEILDTLSKRQISPEDQFGQKPTQHSEPVPVEQRADTIKFKGDTTRPSILRPGGRADRRDSILKKLKKARAVP